MPYDDLPETNEPLVELEPPETIDTQNALWNNANSSLLNMLQENHSNLKINSSLKSGNDRAQNVTDTFRGKLKKLLT